MKQQRRRSRSDHSFLGQGGGREGLPQEENDLDPGPVPPENSGDTPENEGGTPVKEGHRIENLDPAQVNVPRGYFESAYNDEARARLRDSISSSIGQDAAISAKFDGQKYWLAGGLHRVEACSELGLLVRSEVEAGTEEDALDANAANSSNQGQPSQYGYMVSIGIRVRERRQSVEHIAGVMNRNPEWVDQHLICDELLDGRIKEYLRDEQITWGVCTELVKIEDPEEQWRVFGVVQYMSIPEARAYIQGLDAPPETEEPDDDEDDPGTRHVEFEASDAPRERTHKALVCLVCSADGEDLDVVSTPLCKGCLEIVQHVKEVPSLQRGITPMPNDILTGLINVAAGNPIGVRFAEQATAIIERAEGME